MRARVAFVLSALGCALSTVLTAQAPPPLHPGQRVQVTAPTYGLDRTEGTVLAVRGRDVVLALERLRPSRDRRFSQTETVNETLSLDSISGLRIPAGTRIHPGAGAVVGGLLGIVVGALAYTPPPTNCTVNSLCFEKLGELPGRIGSASLGGLVGIGLGALIGSAIHSTRWAPVSPWDLDRLRATIAPLPAGRLGLGAALSFP